MEHQNDVSELDIEAVTKGDSKVNNTINYTTHPSLKADGTPIPNATLSVPLSTKYDTKLDEFHEHRFDSTRAGGSRYYIDGHLMHKDSRLVQKLGGNLQLKLWADGNKWWSGTPSSTTVTMSVKSIIAYFNTTGTADGTNQDWFETCDNAGGPSKDTVCEAYAEVGRDDDLPIAGSGVPTASTTMTAAGAQSPDCWLGICIPTPTSQAVRNQPVFLITLRGFVSNSLSKLNTLFPVTRGKFFRSMVPKMFSRDEPTYTLPFGSPVEDDDDEEHPNTSKSQGARVRPPPWLSTLYARNSTPVTYRTGHIPVVKDLTSDLRTERKIVEGCGRDRNDPCSFGQILDLGKWWSCLRERSDWCFFFSGSSFLLTNGLIQIISVPVIFAWVFYMTEG